MNLQSFVSYFATVLLAVNAYGADVFFKGKALDAAAVEANRIAIKKMLPKGSDAYQLKIASYLTSIGLTPSVPYFKKEVLRLADSSMQFILCHDVEDWACLEAKPLVAPKSISRVETKPALGKAVNAGKSLEIEYFFTQGWFNNYKRKTDKYVIPETTVAEVLAKKISEQGERNIWMAIYGIDDIKNTMSSVYQAIEQKVLSASSNVFAVIDVSNEQRPNSFSRTYNPFKKADGKWQVSTEDHEIDYSYIHPTDERHWAFSAPFWTREFLVDVQKIAQKLPNKNNLKVALQNELIPLPAFASGDSTKNKITLRTNDLLWLGVNTNLADYQDEVSRVTFQYSNSLQLMRLLNKNIQQNNEARAHIEWPIAGIMHNKFFVFENNLGNKSVWAGTANVAQTCMGDEANSNLSILIKNNIISQAFLEEFGEMFIDNSKTGKPKTLSTGLFHDKKRPNTNRYFVFDDKTEVRVHFSPTDDSEHRVLLPLIYSANEGDILRISMFGGGGFELVRAMQMAAARGVDIRIVFDNLTGSGADSWWKDSDANLIETNFFDPNAKGKIEVRKSDWSGLNHHKSATLTRRLKTGQYVPETLVVGSQNWSQSGNDLNDENMVTIRNKTKILPIINAFNSEFDLKMWPSSVPVK